MDAMKSLGVVVFVDIGKGANEYSKLPSQVVEHFKKAKGNSVPTVVISSADLKNNFGAYGYDALKPQDYRSIFKDAKKGIREAKKMGALKLTGLEEPKPEVEEEEGKPLLASQLWTNAKGNKLTAAVMKIDGEKVIFRMPNGKEVPYAISELSADSQAKLKALKE